MKRFAALAFAAVIAAPALAQQGATQIEVEARPLIDQWIEGFNRGDAAGLAKNVYSGADQAALAKVISDSVSDLPPSLQSILAQAQHPTVSSRFQSLQSLWLAAESSQGRKAVAAQPTALVGVLRLPGSDSRAARWPMLVAAGAFFVLAAVIAVVGLRRTSAPSDEVRVIAKSSAVPEEVTIQLELSPSSAKVFIDGKPVQSPLRLGRSEQPLQLAIEADGYQSVSSRLIPDRDRTVHISLASAQPPEPVESSKKRKSSRKK